MSLALEADHLRGVGSRWSAVRHCGWTPVKGTRLPQEFFSLVMRQLMDPSYGMFTFNSRGLYWFSHLDLSELEPKFELVGILLGLALFNGNVLEFAFPKLIFRYGRDR